jgi:hypothetical protein
LAIVRLIDCRPMTKEDEKAACLRFYPRANSWVLADVRRIKPFPVRGRVGLFDVQLPEGIEATVRDSSLAEESD